MSPDSRKGGKSREGARQEFEVAYYTKELGRPLQRKMLERQLASLGDRGKVAHHGEQVSETERAPPQDDRAG
jgi:hypothetical protein